MTGTFNNQLLAARVRAKRGERPLREVAAEIGIGLATLSRIENGKLPDIHTFSLIAQWLGDNPAMYFDVDNEAKDDAINVQLRAVQKMSVETAGAFMEIISAAYMQVFEQTGDGDRA